MCGSRVWVKKERAKVWVWVSVCVCGCVWFRTGTRETSKHLVSTWFQ